MACQYAGCNEKNTIDIIQIQQYSIKYCKKHYDYISDVYNTLILQLFKMLDKGIDLSQEELFENNSHEFISLVKQTLYDSENLELVNATKDKQPDYVTGHGKCAFNGCGREEVAPCFSLGHVKFYFCSKHFKKHGEKIFKNLNGEIKGSDERVGVEDWKKARTFRKMVNNIKIYPNDCEIFVNNLKRLLDEDIKVKERGDYKCQKLM